MGDLPSSLGPGVLNLREDLTPPRTRSPGSRLAKRSVKRFSTWQLSSWSINKDCCIWWNITGVFLPGIGGKINYKSGYPLLYFDVENGVHESFSWWFSHGHVRLPDYTTDWNPWKHLRIDTSYVYIIYIYIFIICMMCQLSGLRLQPSKPWKSLGIVF